MDQNSQSLRELMQQANVSTFKHLIRLANVSEWQVRQLRQGNIAKMRVENLEKLATALQISLTEIIGEFSPDRDENLNLRQECDRLQQQLDRQQENLIQDFQRESLQVIESWLIQWPTAVNAVQKNPQLPAMRLLPLMKPIEALIAEWGLEAIATVGEEIAYDPQWHQLMEGSAEIGEKVKVRYIGYCDREKRLLYRVKVSKIK